MVAHSGRKTPTYFLAPKIATRDGGWYCHYCRCEVVYGHHVYLTPEQSQRKCHVDHVTPIAKGGSDDLENLVLACAKCNLQKGTKTHDEFMCLIGRRS